MTDVIYSVTICQGFYICKVTRVSSRFLSELIVNLSFLFVSGKVLPMKKFESDLGKLELSRKVNLK